MAQTLITPDISTNIPGAYPVQKVQSKPVGLGSSGIVVIFGEADGGASYQNEVLANNVFTPDQLSKVQAKYLSGQIVDAFKALSSPSNDSDITGTANLVYIAKTNSSTRASAIVDTDYGTFSDQNYGKLGNQYRYQVTSIAAEVAPTVTSDAIAAFGAPLNGLSFSIRLNGSAATVVTLSGTSSNHNSAATLSTELNGLLPVGIVASPGTVSGTIKLTVSADSAAYRKGWGKSFELIDSTPGDLAAIGLDAGLTTSSQEPAVEVSTTRSDINFNEKIDIEAQIALNIGYIGTSATLTINQSTKTLTTTVVGGAGASLSIDMSSFTTINDLAAFIASQAGYVASASPSAVQLPTSALDAVSAISIAATESVKPGRVKNALSAFKNAMATSRALSFAASATAGLPNPMALPVYLTGGARGSTSSADIVNVVASIAGIQCNIIVPLFSRDAASDIADAMTDSSSAYTIAAIHAAVKSHCLQYSTPKLKRHRQACLSIWDTYANAKAAAHTAATYRCTMSMQRPTQQNSAGAIVSFLPWYQAVVAAGMQGGGFYKSITNKHANVISYQDPSGFDSGDPGDVSDALSAGLMFFSQDAGGPYWVSDQTTYGLDTNFVYNSMQAVYVADLLALDLAASFQRRFVGQSLADVDKSTALSFLATKMDGYKKLKMIASSSDAPLGYLNPNVSILAPEMDVEVEVKLATAIYFVPLVINYSQIQQ